MNLIFITSSSSSSHARCSLHWLVQAARHHAQVVRHAVVQRQQARVHRGAHSQLLHVHAWARVKQAAASGQGDDLRGGWAGGWVMCGWCVGNGVRVVAVGAVWRW